MIASTLNMFMIFFSILILIGMIASSGPKGGKVNCLVHLSICGYSSTSVDELCIQDFEFNFWV